MGGRGVACETIEQAEVYLQKLNPLFEVYKDESASDDALAAAKEAAKKAGVNDAALAEALLQRRRIFLLSRLAVAVVGQDERTLEVALEEAIELTLKDTLVDDAKSRLTQLVAMRHLMEVAYGDDTDAAHDAFTKAYAEATGVGVHEIRLAEADKERKRHLAE